MREVSTSTKSDDSLACALQWFNNCVNTHSCCSKSAWTKDFLPTRLIDLTPPKQSTQPRLCDSSELLSSVKYATLSHCWGNLPIVRLTNTSLASMMEGLPMSELSETFKDAMFITSRLGVRYLWIDSLCIIQDSVRDWQQESALMGSVYSNAICNIAATGAPNGLAGCFTERNRHLVQPL